MLLLIELNAKLLPSSANPQCTSSFHRTKENQIQLWENSWWKEKLVISNLEFWLCFYIYIYIYIYNLYLPKNDQLFSLTGNTNDLAYFWICWHSESNYTVLGFYFKAMLVYKTNSIKQIVMSCTYLKQKGSFMCLCVSGHLQYDFYAFKPIILLLLMHIHKSLCT